MDQEEISQVKFKLSKQEDLGNTEAGYGGTYVQSQHQEGRDINSWSLPTTQPSLISENQVCERLSSEQ